MENKKKIGIPAVGTWGDVAPMIQLATRLRVEGHQIIIGSTSRYAQPIKEQGFDWVEIGGDLENSRAILPF
jgi:UDP:flavonoid glycosyltransferase YjiC (YdhE family)